MSGSEHPTEWYLARDGKQFGPLSEAELKKVVELGHLRPNDLLWRQGFSDWRPASSVFPDQRATAPAAAAAAPPQQESVQQHAARPDDSARPASENRPALEASGTASRPEPAARAMGSAPSAGGTAQRQPRPGPRANGPAKSHHPTRRTVREPVASRRRFPWVSVTVCLLLAVLAGTALALHRSGRLPALMADLGLGDTAQIAANESGNVTGSNPDSGAQAVSLKVASQSPDVPKTLPLRNLGSTATEIDAGLQTAPLWQLLKKEFPDWYGEQVNEVARLKGEQKDDKAIAQALAEALVALRRKHLADALAASPSRLRQLASSFLGNLGRLAGTSTDACYGYISQGETSPMVVELARGSEHGPHLQAQSLAVFEAIVEGRKAPRAPTSPRREDYDALASQLAQRGWSPADLQLFSDARALSRAPPQKVCQMVQDWFAAQLAVKDEDVQLRLLVEALKPVVAG